MRHKHLAEFAQMCVGALAMKQLPAQLLFQHFDGTGQGGLRDIAPLGGAREIQQVRDRKKIANLMHFHRYSPSSPDRPMRQLRTASQSQSRNLRS
jgi:hypothetical protein